MSYDLMVFEPEAAPKDHQAFMSWYLKVTSWDEGNTYNDPAVTSRNLRSWLLQMQRTYPDMNSFEAADLVSEDDGSLSDYSIDKEAIYVGFAWSKADQAYRTAFSLAAENGLGFFDASSLYEEVWLPHAGALRLAHKKEPSLAARIMKLFKKDLT